MSLQNELIESLVAQGYNGFLVFPGDAVGTSSTLSELSEFGIQSIALAGCLQDPNPAVFCMGADVYNSAYLGTKELIAAMGGQGSIAHFTGFLVDPNTQLRIEAVEKAVPRPAVRSISSRSSPTSTPRNRPMKRSTPSWPPRAPRWMAS